LKIYNDISQFTPVNNPVVTTGTFDGVHLGHRKILGHMRNIALKTRGETVILTFYPHPRTVLFPDDTGLKLLTTQEEKMKLLESQGVDHVIVVPFTKEFSRISSLDFVREILVSRLGTKKLVIGYNHHFGRNREGSFEHLKEFGPLYGFEVEEIPALDVDQIEVSSTKIRKALESGNIEMANAFLGYNYGLSGMVIEGTKTGRVLGFPTANLSIAEKFKLIPGNGVYAVKSIYKGKELLGMANIGIRPTFGGKTLQIEAHFFDFNDNLYGEEINLGFIKKIRDEKKFSSAEALKTRLENDKAEALEILKL
jgi:riboflavin kinase / FMN adenylyltransferase